MEDRSKTSLGGIKESKKKKFDSNLTTGAISPKVAF